MTSDRFEFAATDRLEDTVPDPVPRRRLVADRRRLLEAVALVFIAPLFLGVQWMDEVAQSAKAWKLREDISVVRRGGTGTIDRVQWRLIGRDAAPPAKSKLTPGAVELAVVLHARALDAQGAKQATGMRFRFRDRDGHVWSATGDFPDFKGPPVGVPTQIVVTGLLPESKVNSVVAEVRQDPFSRKGLESVRVLRFAH